MVSLQNRAYVEDPSIPSNGPAFIYFNHLTFQTYLLDFYKESALLLKAVEETPNENIMKTMYF